VNALARQMHGVSRRFLGPAGPAFLHQELEALGVSVESISREHLRFVADRVQRSASQVMQPSQADDFAEALLACTDTADATAPQKEIDSDLSERILAVATDYLGPAGPAFIARELAALGIDENVDFHQVRALADRVRQSGRRVMDAERADEFSDRVMKCGNGGPATNGHSAVIDVTAKVNTTTHGEKKTAPRAADDATPVFDPALLDACRALRASLARTEVDGRLPNLIVLGAIANAECGRVAAGLAMSIAEDGTSTLLVDADFVAPSLHEPFGLPLENGFAEALTAEVPVIVPTRVGLFLSVLAAGQLRDAGDSRKIASRIGQVAKGLAERFESVIYYCSTTVGRTLALLGPQVGGAVLVVRLGVDTADQVRATREQLERAGITVLGFAPMDTRSTEALRFAWGRGVRVGTSR
jgi:Mrp family chromosome partitioning ATPase